MDLYWNLASADALVRECAAVALVGDLQRTNQQQQHRDASSQRTQTQEDLVHQDVDLSGCSPALQYALRRLVRGVSSSRESARQGFATALALVLEEFTSVKAKSVLDLIKKILEVSSSMKGQEMRDGLLGQLFAFGAVVRAGSVVKNCMEADRAILVKEITEQLLTLGYKKLFLRELAVSLLLHFIDKLPKRLLQDGVLASSFLDKILRENIENGNADVLLVAIRLEGDLPTSTRDLCTLLPKSSNIHAMFSPSHLSSLVPILKESSNSHPRVHPIWSVMIRRLFANGTYPSAEVVTNCTKKKRKRQKLEADEVVGTLNQRLACFWSLVVEQALLTSSHERKNLAFELVCLILPSLSAALVPIVLSNTFVRCLTDNLSSKDNLLYKCAERCLNHVVDWAKQDEQCIVAVLLSLQKGSLGKFDTLTKTHTSKQLVASLRLEEGCFAYYDGLLDLFTGDENDVAPVHLANGSFSDREGGKEVEKHEVDFVKTLEIRRYWVLDHLCSLVKQADVEEDVKVNLQKNLLSFLTLHGLFVSLPGVKLTVQGIREENLLPKVAVSENIKKLCLTRLQTFLVNCSMQSSSGGTKDKKTSVAKPAVMKRRNCSLDLRLFFLEFYDQLNNMSGLRRVEPPSKDDQATIDVLRGVTLQLLGVVGDVDTEKLQKVQAMGSLVMQLLLQSMISRVNDVAMELVLCSKRAFTELINVDIDEDDNEQEGAPAFIDVLIDVLLALLAQSSAPIRASAEQVFKAFCGDVTEPALLSLLRVLKKQLKSARRMPATPLLAGDSDEEQLLDIEDSEEDMDDNDDNDDDDDDDDDHDDNNDDTMLDTDQNGEQNGVPNNSDGSVVDNKAKCTNESSEDDDLGSDMDDEAMFRFDTHLTKLLKQASRKGESKDSQTQLLHFKLRVLSLVEFFLQRKSGSALALIALQHLLQTLALSSSTDSNPELVNKICSILKSRLCKSKHYPKGLQVDVPSTEALLQRCLRLASRSKVKQVREAAQECCLWLLKVLQSKRVQGEGGSNMTLIMEDALNNFFSQKNCCLKSRFFRDVFVRFPHIGLACLSTLLDKSTQARSEYLRHEAVSLAHAILRHKSGKEASQNETERGRLRDCLQEHVPAAIAEMLVNFTEKPAGKAFKKSEAWRFCLTLLKVISREIPEKPIKQVIGKSAYKLCLSYLGTSVMEDVLKVRLSDKSKEGADERKHKKSSKINSKPKEPLM